MSQETIVIDLSPSGRKLSIDLEPSERAELEEVRDTHEKAYVREKAAATLKVADGWSAKDVAEYGLNTPRRPNTVRRWIDIYRDEGIEGWIVDEGRGRPPAFSP